MFTFILKQGTEGNLCKFDTSLTAVEFTWKTQPNAIQNYGGGECSGWIWTLLQQEVFLPH